MKEKGTEYERVVWKSFGTRNDLTPNGTKWEIILEQLSYLTTGPSTVVGGALPCAVQCGTPEVTNLIAQGLSKNLYKQPQGMPSSLWKCCPQRLQVSAGCEASVWQKLSTTESAGMSTEEDEAGYENVLGLVLTNA